ncbi:MAG: HipA domain-containing protein [Hyphomonadaceae bacterium]|nr:HipA domain-containing protein [Hyphomonadaceae bacterium]
MRDRAPLYIAKFPWARDEWPVILWEAVLLKLAEDAGIAVAPNRMTRIGTKPVLLTQRFDREAGSIRVPFISAMTALDAQDHSEGRSYIEILDVIRQFGAAPLEDARQLWRRMVFNVLVSNTDDHLRNHGFLWAGQGWRLSPAYDMNPAPPHVSGRMHVLALNELDSTSSIDIVMSIAKAFGLTLNEAMGIAGEVGDAVTAGTPMLRRRRSEGRHRLHVGGVRSRQAEGSPRPGRKGSAHADRRKARFRPQDTDEGEAGAEKACRRKPKDACERRWNRNCQTAHGKGGRRQEGHPSAQAQDAIGQDPHEETGKPTAMPRKATALVRYSVKRPNSLRSECRFHRISCWHGCRLIVRTGSKPNSVQQQLRQSPNIVR